jgi:Flp pilus assembly protein CpaB
VAGGLLVAAAAIGTFAAWSGAGDAPATRYVVAAVDLPVGHVVTAADLELAAVDAPSSLAARAFASAEAVIGQRTVAPLAEGDLVQRSAVVVPEDDEGGRQVSFAIDLADGLAGTLEEGESVDLLATTSGPDGAVTEVVAAGARVARLPVDPDDGGRLVVLLTLPPDADVLTVTTAIRTADLTLVRSGAQPALTTGTSDG